MKKYYVFFFLIILFSCEFNDLDDRSHRPKAVKYMDISDAEYLAIETRKTDGEVEPPPVWSNLYKLVRDEQGLFPQKIGFKDNSGERIDSIFTLISVHEILPISDEFICLKGYFKIKVDSSVNELIYESLLVNTNDGSIYDFNDHFPNPLSYNYDKHRLQKDEEGNMYYDYNQSIYKLEIHQDILTQELYVPSNQLGGSYFYISSDANCFFNGAGISRVKLFSGGILIFDEWHEDVFGSKGRVFVQNRKNITEINEIKIVDNVYKVEKSFYLNGYHPEIIYFKEMDDYSYVITTSNFTLVEYGAIIGFALNVERNSLIELMIRFDNNEEVSYHIINCADNFLWASSMGGVNKKIIRYDLTKFDIEIPIPSNPDFELAVLNSFVSIEFPSNLDILSYQFIENDEISFHAFDLSEEKDVTGIINMESEITITNVQDNYTLEILKRLNK